MYIRLTIVPKNTVEKYKYKIVITNVFRENKDLLKVEKEPALIGLAFPSRSSENIVGRDII